MLFRSVKLIRLTGKLWSRVNPPQKPPLLFFLIHCLFIYHTIVENHVHLTDLIETQFYKIINLMNMTRFIN